jgi:hypothetical protein
MIIVKKMTWNGCEGTTWGKKLRHFKSKIKNGNKVKREDQTPLVCGERGNFYIFKSRS